MLQKDSKSVEKVVWAVDVFDGSDESRKHVANALAQLGRKNRLKVEPVYVLSPEQLDLPIEFSPPWIKKYRPAAEASLQQMLKGYPIHGLVKPRVLTHYKSSLSGAVRSLATHAKAIAADLIVVGTHGRRGLSRFVLGSFAESLLLQAHTPVLVVGPGAHATRDFSRILFATDFSKISERVFMNVLALARKLGSKVTVLHNITNPIEPVFQSGVYLLGGAWIPVPIYLEKQEARARQLGDIWIKRAHRSKVDADLVMDVNSLGVVQSILDHAEKQNYGLIAMAAQSGKVSSALIGSITRQVVRGAPCPVWVLRP